MDYKEKKSCTVETDSECLLKDKPRALVLVCGSQLAPEPDFGHA